MLVYLTSATLRRCHADLGWDILDAAVAGPQFPSLESVKIRLIFPTLTNGPDTEVVDEARWDVAARDLSPIAMVSFPLTAQRMREAPTMELKFLMLDHDWATDELVTRIFHVA
jgi:hypothetical protein